jgi:glutathione S-transferase
MNKLTKTGIELIGSKVCPYVQRICLLFSYKKLDYNFKIINPLEQKSDEFKKISPYNKIPVILLEDGKSIYESAAIFQYIDEEFQPKILTGKVIYSKSQGTSYEKAIQRIWTHFSNTKLSNSLYLFLFEKNSEPFLHDLEFLESFLAKNSGKYFYGDKYFLI